MAKGLEVCHKIDFTHKHTHPPFLSLFHFCLLSALVFITLPVNSSQYFGLSGAGLWGLQEGQGDEEGELSLVWESLGMAEEPAESSGVRRRQGKVMF